MKAVKPSGWKKIAREYDHFASWDPESTALLQRFGTRIGFTVLLEPGRMNRVWPQFEQVFWNPVIPVLRSFIVPPRKPSVSLFFHQLVHHLTNAATRLPLASPESFLLGECMATTFDCYFMMLRVRHLGLDSAQAAEVFGVELASKSDRLAFDRMLTAISEERYKDEFDHFFRTLGGFYALALERFDRVYDDRIVESRPLALELERLPSAWVLRCFQLANNILYSKVHGRRRAGARDRRAAEQVNAIVAQSTTCFEVLAALESLAQPAGEARKSPRVVRAVR